MASPPNPPPGAKAIGGHYVVDVARPLPLAGGGMPAFAATDRRTGQSTAMALLVARHAPARARSLQALVSPIEGLLTPLAHGKGPVVNGDAGYFVICQQPPGPPLSATLQPWPEQALIEQVLHPIARVLEQIHSHAVTHRAIRIDNVFRGKPGQSVILGAAWAAPPAMHQPAIYEPPYSAMCLPSGRGDGSVNDDVYALGVLLITLALGRVPMADMDNATVIRRKLELGSYAALVGDARLPPWIGDLASGMIAEDPDHRPQLKLLRDLAAARGRKVATRPPQRAARPLQIGRTEVWNLRTLAYAMSSEPEAGVLALTGTTLLPWLRRGLGESALAMRLEEMLRGRRDMPVGGTNVLDPAMVMHVIAIVDPLAPLCWNGLALWPDGMGPAIAAAQVGEPATVAGLETLIGAEAVASWAALRAERCDHAALRIEARQNRSWLQLRGPCGGIMRLGYTLNPMLPGGGSLAAGRWVVSPADVPATLELVAAGAGPDTDVVDPPTMAFIAARADRRLGFDVNALNTVDREDRLIAQLKLLSELQQRFDPQPVPALAKWFAVRATSLVARWRNRTRRAAIAEKLTALSAVGILAPILTLIEDPAGQAADAEAASRATAEFARIDSELAAINSGAQQRASSARRTGQEIAAGIGLAGLATVLIVAALA